MYSVNSTALVLILNFSSHSLSLAGISYQKEYWNYSDMIIYLSTMFEGASSQCALSNLLNGILKLAPVFLIKYTLETLCYKPFYR